MRTPGEQLKAAREARGVSAKTLADAIGVDKGTVFRWEAGKFGPTTVHQHALSAALGLPATFFPESRWAMGSMESRLCSLERRVAELERLTDVRPFA